MTQIQIEGAPNPMLPRPGSLAASVHSRLVVIAPSLTPGRVTWAIGAPGLAPDAAEDEDSVLQELDKLIARLDAEAARARAVTLAAPPLPASKARRWY